MPETIRVGIIGAGWAGSSHAAAYSRLENVSVTGMWGRTKPRAEKVVDQLDLKDARVYDLWQDLIESGEVDAISVATPPALRGEPISAALKHGLHVLAEKPFTGHLDEARELVSLAGQYDLVTAVSFNWRYSPWNLAAYKAIHEGQLGQIRHIRTDWRIRIAGDLESFLAKRAWQKNTDTGGGVMRQGGGHEFDLVRFLTGLDFSRAVARLTYHPFEGVSADAGCSLMVELNNKAIAEFRLMITTGQRERQIRLEGEEGSLLVTDEGAIRQYRDDDQPLHLQIGDDDQIPEGEETLQHTWNRLIEEFCSAIQRGDTKHNTVPNLPTFADGLRSQELISAAEVSDAEMRWVQIDELQ